MNRIARFQLGMLLLCIGLFSTVARETHADVRLPGFFTDHMVLQQQRPIKIWGWADAGESVTVTVADQTATAKANDQGKWDVELAAREASQEPITLTVQGENKIELSDILVGEVWLCSGQSNMEWPVQRSENAKQEIASANFPLIRHVKFSHRPSMSPLDDIKGTWKICSPDTVDQFSAAGYFMARRLHQELNVPIGLINSSWGGTRVEPWTPLVGFAENPALAKIHQSVLGRTVGTPSYESAVTKHIATTEAWLVKARQQQQAGERVDSHPAFPPTLMPFKSHQDPTMLYNGMIHAIVGYPIRGAIWYQGESNHAEGMLYFEKKKSLINGWRKLWGQGDFSFYYVQIAPFQYGNEDSGILPTFWEAQAAVEELPNTGMVVINDIATLNDIHPPNKQDVGSRLAGLALKHDYGRSDLVAHSPSVKKMEADGGTIKLRFKNTGGGLKTRDGKPATHFEVADKNAREFHAAAATIDGDTVTLKSPQVAEPAAVRFAWHKLAEPNLVGGTGLPVGAFRAGSDGQ